MGWCLVGSRLVSIKVRVLGGTGVGRKTGVQCWNLPSLQALPPHPCHFLTDSHPIDHWAEGTGEV